MKKKFAFSLLELSVVILIVSLIVAGVFQGGKLINKAKLSAASQMTKNSIVGKMDGLVLWYETTMTDSLEEEEAIDDNAVSVWYDISDTAETPNDATQGVSANQPKYTEKAINDLPALNFNGTNSFLSFNGRVIANSNYTIFVVEKRTKNALGFIVAADPSGNNFHVGYHSATGLRLYQMSSYQCDAVVPSHSLSIPRIHSVTFGINLPAKYHINGQSLSSCSNIGTTYESSPSVIARSQWGYYGGNIGEIIMFNRVLNDEERENVEKYLSDKWGIAI